MADPIPTISWTEPAWRREFARAGIKSREYLGATRTHLLEHKREFVISTALGLATRSAARAGLIAAGFEGLPVLILVGAGTGAVVATYKEHKRAGSWADMEKKAIFWGAISGAAGGVFGGALSGVLEAATSQIHLEAPRLDIPGSTWINEHNPVQWVKDRAVDLNNQNESARSRFIGWVNNNTPIRLPEVAMPKVSAAYPGDLPADYGGGTTPIEQPQRIGNVPGPENGPTSSGAVAPIPEVVSAPQVADLADKLLALEHNNKIETEVAKEVGRILAGVPENSPLHPQIQTILETQGHDSMMNALKEYIRVRPNFDINNDVDLIEAGKAARATFLQDYEGKHLDNIIKALVPTAEAAPVPTDIHQTAQEVTKFVTENQNNPEIFTSHIVGHGETAGHLIQEMGITPTWDGTDLHGFAALWFSNPGAFKDIATGMGMTPEELLKLLHDAPNNPSLAQKVYKSMGLIREGTHLRIPTRVFTQTFGDELKRRLAYGG